MVYERQYFISPFRRQIWAWNVRNEQIQRTKVLVWLEMQYELLDLSSCFAEAYLEPFHASMIDLFSENSYLRVQNR